MELYDKRPVACRIVPLVDGKDNTQYSIYNKVDASDPASDQPEYTWIYHKRPVACRIAHFVDKRTKSEQKVKIFWHQSCDAPSGGGCAS